ncbi:DNA topoisomerase 3 [Lamprobacter modestohalophilus]|uniref:type IA DNA topoisomerase n=1 Tax=Lamprobacter modestohalophilus TaxID=1064514 RepID=UPI002ADEF7D9|nr:DNA topoisomerase 3 [Lamprobacter modestohalophilus]MEA1049819.1 DNA topoisomerase 3 [Lamprobacter modestohalophilus]
MRVIVAEKPSVARDLARILGANSRREGYLEGQGWRVTWALGHLVHFAEPDAYGEAWAGRWSFAQLPMLPERWRLRTDKKTAAQFKIVKALLTDPATERVICATDAGREGELIFRLIAEHARCRKPVQRLWISSLTDAAIRAGLAQLRDGHNYDALAAAARARAQADWLIGMNLTRAYTVHNRVLCTIGRVQTPTLAMIVTRDQAIDAFVPTPFFELIAQLAEGFEAKYHKPPQAQQASQGLEPKRAGVVPGEHPTRLDNKAEAEALRDRLRERIRPENLGQVVSVETKPQRNRPPPLFDLTTLQREANRRYGFTAAKTLELAQSLYETYKLISYPRTESRHIGEDLVPELPGILQQLDHPLAGEALARLEGGHRLGRAYVDQTKLTDHHAILPTATRPPSALPEPLRRIYDLVAARFVAVFLPDQRVEETEVQLDIGGETFIAKGRVVTDPGWTRADPRHLGRVEGSATGSAAGRHQGRSQSGESAQQAPTQQVHGQLAHERQEHGQQAQRQQAQEQKANGQQPQAGLASVDEANLLPALTQGQTVHVASLDLAERETQPPKRFEDATLLNAMKYAGREIEDKALAAAMKGAGLGTPATRAETIEKLIRTGYVERQRKQLVSTDKGRALIGLVAEPLKSAELTAGWEQRLKDIEEGRAEAAVFHADINRFVTELIPQVARGAALPPEQVAAARAARGTASSTAGRSRKKASPGGSAGRRGRSVGRQQQSDLSTEVGTRGRSSPPAPPQPREPRVDAANALSAQLAEIRSALQLKPLRCPKCGQGQLIVGRRGYGCSRWREGCDFVIWQVIAGHPLSEAELRALVEHGKTAPIDGLYGDNGRGGSAVLCLGQDGQVAPVW